MAAGYFERRLPVADARRGQFANLAWDLYCDLDRTQWEPRADLEQHQLRLARRLVEHAMAEVPHYRDRYAAAGIDPAKIESWEEFRKVPILSRSEYQGAFDRLEAATLPPGQVATSELTTSGTTGIPIRVRQTNLVNTFWYALLLRDTEWCGIDPHGSVAVIRSSIENEQGKTQKVWGRPLSDIIVTGPAHGMSIRAPAEEQLRWLQEVQSDYLLSYTSNLEFLAGLAIERGLKFPALKVVQSFAESLEPEVERKIAEGFGAPVKNLYTSQEAGYIASPCPKSDCLHVHGESILLELLDDQDRPVKSGEKGRIVLTTLRNFRSPFIRYDIGDEAIAGPESCVCGRGLPALQSVSGKKRPMFKLPDGRVKNSSGLVVRLREVGGFLQFQVAQQRPDRFVVRLAPSREWSEERRQRVIACLQGFMESPVEVVVETLEHIPRTAQGKLQSIVVEVA